jgi:hypothetical protein
MAIRRVRVGVILYSIQMTKTVIIKSPTIFIDYLLGLPMFSTQPINIR